MRQTLPSGYQYDESISHPVTFKNPDGNVLELFIVSSNIIRVRHTVGTAPKGEHKAGDSFTVKKTYGTMEIQTPSIRVVIELPGMRLVWYDVNDPTTPFAEDLKQRAYAYDKHNDIHWHYRIRYPDDLYYGLGERTGNMNLAGRRFRLERLDSMGYDSESQDPLYKFCPYYVTLSHTTRRAHGIFYQNFGATTVDLGQEFDAMWGPYTYYQTEAGPLDYFVIYGPSVPAVVRNFGMIVGRPRHLPPRYSFGYLASSMAYAEADNAQEQLESFAELCRKHDIPCDGMHLSSGYTVVDCGDRCVFTWNKKRFPDPERLAKRLKQDGIHIFANVKPWLLHNSHPDFEQVKRNKGLVWDPERNCPSTVWQWRGGRHTMGEASYIDFTSKAGYAYWQSKLKSELVDIGYDIWLDNNEFTMLDDSHTYACQVPPEKFDMPFYEPHDEGDKPCKTVGTPLQTLLMVQASYDVLRDALPDQRPFLITRSSVPFCQQLVNQTWSGDNYTEWKTIRYNVAMGVGSALCAMPTGYGHDVGGFAGPKPDQELFVRWVQQGIFWPRFCIHSWNEDGTVTEPWMYPDALPVIRAAIHFRYRLIPYIYSLHVTLVHRVGEPLVRPVLYDYQLDTETHEQQFEFMLGPDMLVAPVIEPGQTIRQVYLPQDTAWYHYQTGQYFTGGKIVGVPSKIEDAAAPLFIKAGSIICLGKVMKSVHDQPDDDRRVQIFPERWHEGAKVERRTLTMIEDDGKTLYHEKGGAYAEVQVWMEADENEIRIGLEIVHDGYFPDYDTVWVTCPISSETRRLVFEDAEMMQKQVDDDCLCSYVRLSVAQARKRKQQACH